MKIRDARCKFWIRRCPRRSHLRTRPAALLRMAILASIVLAVVAVGSLMPREASASGGPGTAAEFLPTPGPNTYPLDNNGPPMVVKVRVTTTLDAVEANLGSLSARLVEPQLLGDFLLENDTKPVNANVECIGQVIAGATCTVTFSFSIRCVNEQVVGATTGNNTGKAVVDLALEFVPGGNNFGAATARCVDPFGGIVEIPVVSGGSGLSFGGVVTIAGVVAAIAVAAGIWYGRRRWLR
jgi:hypothetical protein